MFYKLYNLLSDIVELLMLYGVNRIDIDQLHKYICDDVDMFIEVNPCIFISKNTKFTPSPAAMSGKRKEKNVSSRQNCRN